LNYELTVGKSGFLRTGIINAAGKRVSFNMNNALIPNNWNYIVMTYDGTKIKGYANGQLKGEMAQTGLIKATASILTLGGDGSRYRFSGILDELRIHTRAWNAEKILSEYQKAKTLMVLNIDETEIEETEKTKFLNFPNRIYPRDTTWLENFDYHDNNWFNQVKIKHLYAKEYFLDNETNKLTSENTETQNLQTKKLISSQLTYHFSDHLGSSSFTINELHQKILQISDYYAFGQKRTFENLDNSSLKNRKQFTGKEQDEGTNLYYFGARYYDAEIGRWTQIDNMAMFAASSLLTDPQALNLYTYARNNPIALVDPDGNFWNFVVSAVVGVAIAAWDLLTTPVQIAYAPTINSNIPYIPERKPLETIAPSYAALSKTAQTILDITVGVVIAGAGAAVKPIVKTVENVVEPTVKRITQIKVKPLFSSRNLERNMTIKGMIKPAGTETHHIVAGGSPKAIRARELLDKFGIKLDDSVNGVYLQKNTHRSLHTTQYYIEVNKRLKKATSKPKAIEILNDIRTELLNGKFPN